MYTLAARASVQSRIIEELEWDLRREMWDWQELDDAQMNLPDKLEDAKAQVRSASDDAA